MKGKKNGSYLRATFGAGYASVIMIFVVIVLAVLASLSYTAVCNSDAQNERAHENMRAYYTADAEANRKLMKLDEAAWMMKLDGSEPSLFETKAAEIEGVTVENVPEGYSVSWSERINEKVKLDCEITVFDNIAEHDLKRYEITKWETVTDAG